MKIFDLWGHPIYEYRVLGFVVRLFTRPRRRSNWPFLFRRYGLWGFGVGPVGVNLWTPMSLRRQAREIAAERTPPDSNEPAEPTGAGG